MRFRWNKLGNIGRSKIMCPTRDNVADVLWHPLRILRRCSLHKLSTFLEFVPATDFTLQTTQEYIEANFETE